jgi:4-amino-4-deoxy-L-arabinose transferase-like glycosyltransferase
MITRNMIRTSSTAPIVTAIVCSVLLSIIAIYFNPILGRDSAFYIDLAQNIKTNGLKTTLNQFNWPWLSLMIATTHDITRLSLINCAYVIMLLLTAGTCAILTRTAQVFNNKAGWWGCLISLSIPAFNGYRDLILREPGFWFFTALTIYLVSIWSKSGKWHYLLLALLSILLAMAFRLESIFLAPALALTLAWHGRAYFAQYKTIIFTSAGVLSVALAIFVLLFSSGAIESSRIDYYASLINPSELAATLGASANTLSDAILAKYSHDDAATILLLGFLGLILLKALLLNGPFLIPLIVTSKMKTADSSGPTLTFITIALLIYLLILLIFFIQQNFMIDRYLAQLHILAFSLITLSALQFQKHFPRTSYVLVFVAILVALSNVVSLSPKRTHYIPAGNWISENIPPEKSTFYSDGRISFYAGRGFTRHVNDEQALSSHFSEFDYFVIEDTKDNETLETKIKSGSLTVIAEFDNDHNREMMILKKAW